MIINHNISALNAWRGLSQTNSALAKSLEKLSSGLRINRAADDAAGLAISEKMRGQINGLNQAVRNAQDGISLIQTAEGALNETHSILQRMRQLAVQAASDTSTNDDRQKIQAEMDQLAKELSRISNTTEFNTKNLLAGGFSNQYFHIGANKGQYIDLSINAMDAKSLGVATDYVDKSLTTNAGIVVEVIGRNLTASMTADITLTIKANSAVTTQNITYAVQTALGSLTVYLSKTSSGNTATLNDIVNAINNTQYLASSGFTFRAYLKVTDSAGTPYDANASAQTETVTINNSAIKTSKAAKVTVNGGIIDEAVAERGIVVLTQNKANDAISIINDAITRVSEERSKLGAVQNRLEHTIANLGVASENLSAAESRIRDVDMAQEMMNFTRNQILVQAGTAMLAQANMAPQAVLKLLG